MPILTWPIAMFGLAALPGVAVIYMLRTRSRRHVVSSLMLWADQRRPRAGGLKFQRIQTPLLLFLELLAVALLVLAAAGPRIPTDRNTRPLIVVLDDSFSMQAGAEASPQSLALQAVKAELETDRHRPVQFVLAAARPRVLGRPTHTLAQAVKTLEGWTCRAPGADINAAMTLAAALSEARDASQKARILVLTDHAPPDGPPGGDIRWRSFGRPRANLAVTAAARGGGDSGGRCLVEIANFSDRSVSANLTIDGLGAAGPRTVPLGPGATGTLRLDVPASVAVVRATLGDDDLAVDNAVTLLPPPGRIVRVKLDVAGAALRRSLDLARIAPDRALVTSERVALLITDQSPPAPTGRDTWLVQFISEPDASVYTGPFVADRAHPLTDGLSLAGLYWAAGKTTDLPGRAVVAAGNVPLITELRRPGRRREIRIRLRGDLSTLQDSTNWPVLIWNILEYRASALPGLRETTIRLGARASVVLPDAATRSVTVTDPSGRDTRSPAADRVAVIPADSTGVFKVAAPGIKCQFAVNAVSAAESDLRKCTSGDWGNWLSARAIGTEYMPMAWLLVLVALAVLVAHAAILSTARRTRHPQGDGGAA